MKTLSILFFTLFLSIRVTAQLDPTSVFIPMTDGNELAGDLYLPNDTDTFPTILIQTPYNKNFYLFSGLPLSIGYDISMSDYAILIVDWRCFFESTAACTLDFNRGEDGYDVVEWVVQQSWSNGKVGTWGPSALGNIQFEVAPCFCTRCTRSTSVIGGPLDAWRGWVVTTRGIGVSGSCFLE